MKDLLLIDKPKGITSFDCIRILRKKLGIKKMGHAGTLDPLATGLMIIGLNEGTKKLNDYLKLPKTYLATIRLGIKTDTGDLEGKVVVQEEVKELLLEEIKEAGASLIGENELEVPKYSAIKKNGKALYKYAREGQEVEVPIKKMVVNEAKVISYNHPDIEIEFDVESGVYIRSLAEELGRRLNAPATLVDLRRTRVGEFRVEEAELLDREV